MNSAELYESYVQEVSNLERSAMIARLLHFDGTVPLDFSPEYLNACTTERLRHILVAALWRSRMKDIVSAL